MEENYIQLKKDENILRLHIRDEEGKDTGESLIFDLKDISIFEKYQKIIDEDKKSREELKRKFLIIEKKQDHKGIFLESANEEEKLKIIKEFYEKQVELYNLFLGENGVQKLLNGRNLNWTTLAEINEIINTCIIPKFKVNAENIKDEIINKYSLKSENKGNEIIEE